jgi:Rrf2 family protein
VRLTNLCVHALWGLAHLARHEGGRPVTAEAIAGAEGLSRLYLVKALEPLASAGVLRSVKGPNGGYGLARPARDITLLEVVEAVEGPVRGQAPRFAPDASRLDDRLQRACDEVAGAVRRRLGQVSLAELAGGG